jgi:hypothetical protein
MDGVWYRPGFTNRPNRKAIEALVDSYLALISNGARLRQERKFIEKAIMIINKILGHPCCDEATAVVDFGTPYENQITTSLKNIFFAGQPVRRSFRYALFRMLDKFNLYLYGCCTSTLTVNFTTAVPADVTINFTDLVSGAVLFTTTIGGGTTQTATLPAQYFGPGALIQVGMDIINAPTSPAQDHISDGSSIILSASAVGEHTSLVLENLQPVYTITMS